jgi:hypothetical protein
MDAATRREGKRQKKVRVASVQRLRYRSVRIGRM